MPFRNIKFRKGGTKSRFSKKLGKARASAVTRRRSQMAPRGIPQGEIHSFNTTAAADLTTTATITLLNGMAQGTDSDERAGRKTHGKTLSIKLLVSNEAGAPFMSPMRVMVIYDKQSNKAAPIIGDLLDTTTMTASKNINNRDRFQVLGDEVIQLGAGAATTGSAGNMTFFYKRFFNLRNLETTFADASAGVGSVNTGALYLVYFGTFAAGSTDYDVDAKMRLRFLA